MKFYDAPLLVESNPQENATDLLLERVRKSPQHAIFSRQNPDKSWRNVTAADFLAEVQTLAKGLIDAGIEPGQAVAIMSKTRYEWSMIDFAIWFAGAVTVPIYESSSPAQIEWILSDSDAVALFIENDEHQARVDQIRSETPRVNHIWQIDSSDFTKLHQAGEKVADEVLETARTNATLGDLATIVYTSGTTGNPKGCELTHRSLVDHCKNAPPRFLRLQTTDSTL